MANLIDPPFAVKLACYNETVPQPAWENNDCDEMRLLNADDCGLWSLSFEEATLSRTRRSFGTVPRGDRQLGSRQRRPQPNAYAPDPMDAIRAGLPRAVAPAGTSRVTTLPAPITALSPMVTPRQNDRTAADPHILTDPDGASELGTRLADRRVARMVCRVDLDRRADLGSRSNGHGNDIKDHAIEIEKHA